MRRELFLSGSPGEIRAALAEDDRIVELKVARESHPSLLRAIFLARVVRVVPALPGAFLDLGGSISAFLPMDRGANAVLPAEGAALIVQVVKEAHGGKPPEVTAALSIQASHMVWTPMRPGIAVSRQIAADERARLSHWLKDIIREGEGVVVRTAGAGASKETLAADAAAARLAYATLLERSKTQKPPVRLDTAEDIAQSLVLSFNPGICTRIVADDPHLVVKLRHLGIEIVLDKNGEVFAEAAFEEIFDAALARSIDITGRAGIVIDAAEACAIIDVNLGSSTRGAASEAILHANHAAAVEIARQLRLRNIGGAIVIDFISMRSQEHRRAIEKTFVDAAAGDPTAIEVHGWTRLGHLEVTRQRQGASLAETLLEPAVTPRRTPETTAYAVLRTLKHQPVSPGSLVVTVYPVVASLLEGPLHHWFAEVTRASGRPIHLKSDAFRASDSYDIANSFDVGTSSSSISHHE